MEKLLLYLNTIHPLSSGLIEHLQSILKIKELPKKAYLLRQGSICANISFIEKGLLRCFYVKEDREVCSWFMKEGDVIISVESFFKQKVSFENIQALEECVLYYINYNELQYIYRNFSEFNFIARVLTEQYYTLSEQRLYSIRMQRGYERYQYLRIHFPELIKRVPSKYIASYLSITEETLSRVRSRK
jgi:CRP-like cAMP-binding protein